MERCLYCMHFKHEVHGNLDLCLECIKKLYEEILKIDNWGWGLLESKKTAVASALKWVEPYVLSEMR